MSIEDKLNSEQVQAARHIDGPLLVLAGAGSGKTRCVTFRILHLLQLDIPAHAILGVTFTNKAAAEMRERVRETAQQNVLISTFHSLGARILRDSIHHLGYKATFTIYDEDDVDKLLKACLKDFGLDKADHKPYRSLISNCKNRLEGPDNIDLDAVNSRLRDSFPKVYRRYQESLHAYNGLDFDDLLFLCVRLFREHPEVLERYQNLWRYVLIDEYQDTNAAQYEIVRLLVQKTHNIFAVGDPDQSIYSWRGANINNILNFETDFQDAKVVRLEQNYRSRTNILEAANAVIAHNDRRYEKKLWSDRGPGEKIKHFTGNDDREEARFVADKIRYHHEHHGVPLSEMAILYRTNFQSRSFEDQLLNRSISYVIVGGISFYHRREIKDMMAFLRLVLSGADYVSFERTINLPKRGIGDTTIAKIRQASAESGMEIIDFCERLAREEGVADVRLNRKQKDGLKHYVETIRTMRESAEEGLPLHRLMELAIDRSGYLAVLDEDPETSEDRNANIKELLYKVEEWEKEAENATLANFLEEMALKSTLDEVDGASDRLNLMTLHNGKGLEFQVIFLVGMEEKLLPHVNSLESSEALEEERRLCYVGMTRAKELLYLCNVRLRRMWGIEHFQHPSRFLKEIPREFIENIRLSHAVIKPMKKEFDDFIDEDLSIKVEAKAPAVQQEFAFGDAIYHEKYGIGVIQDVYQGGAGLTYKVMFSKETEPRRLAAKFANLTKL